MSRPQISDEELLDALREFADELGHTPTTREMKGTGPYSATTYVERFDSWPGAVRAAGLAPATTREKTDEELLAGLREFAEEIGHSPTTREMDADGPYSSSAYARRFGRYNVACELAGLVPSPDCGGVRAKYEHLTPEDVGLEPFPDSEGSEEVEG